MIISNFPYPQQMMQIATYYAQKQEDFILLDSSLTTEEHHYQILALKPYYYLSCHDHKVYINGVKQNKSFSQCLDEYLKNKELENTTQLPFLDGLIGYYSYEYGVKNLNINLTNSPLYPLADANLQAYDILLIQDTITGATTLITHGHTVQHQAVMEEMIRICQNTKKINYDFTPNPSHNYKTIYTAEQYQNLVKSLIKHMVDGDIYVANLTQPFILPPVEDTWSYYMRLRNLNPAPLSAYFQTKDLKILCTSMETLLKVEGKKVTTRPIKGTRKRGNTKNEDQALYQELATSLKDRSELMMITDLERNDFNHCCLAGSVKTKDDFTIEKYATVFQLVADIKGILAPSITIPQFLDTILPGGSITGAPKHRAITLLQEHEQIQRQLYTGALGYISTHHTAQWNIVIRTAVQTNNQLYLQAGGGITAESDPPFEYEETLQKIRGLLNALPLNKGV